MDISVKEVTIHQLDDYAKIPMCLTIKSKLIPKRIDSGFSGLLLEEIETSEYIKDYSIHANPYEWLKNFDTSNWGFFIAYDGHFPIGGATLVQKTAGLNMLSGRDDLCVLWDIRVSPEYKSKGVGKEIFQRIKEWSVKHGCKQLKIETQNTNVPACRFYINQGAILCAYDEYAYYGEEDEIQLIWYLDL